MRGWRSNLAVGRMKNTEFKGRYLRLALLSKPPIIEILFLIVIPTTQGTGVVALH